MEEPETTRGGFDHQQIAAMVRETMAARGLSQSEVARQADMSAAVLSEFLSGTYRGNRDEAARKLSAWYEGLAEGDGFAATIERISTFADTMIAKRIMAALKLAKLGKMVSIVGTSGVGKTMALRRFARDNPAVWYCQFSKDTKTVFSILAEIAAAVGIQEMPSRPDIARREIVSRIERKRGLILCDEAQHLTSDGFEMIRSLHDRAEVGIVFAGHLDLADKIARLPQVAGRISAPLRIGGAKPEDADALFASWSLECKRSRDFLRRFANRPTGLRRIAAAYQLAALYAFGEEAAVTFDHISRAWSDLEGPAQAI